MKKIIIILFLYILVWLSGEYLFYPQFNYLIYQYLILLAFLGNTFLFYLVWKSIKINTKKNKELIKLNEQLCMINQLAMTASQSLELKQVLSASLKNIMETLIAQKGMISIYDSKQNALQITVEQDYPLKILDLEKLVFRKREPLIIQNVLRDRIEDGIEKVNIPDELHDIYINASFLGIPLTVKDKVLGVISLIILGGINFSPRDREYFKTIGSQLGIAVENALVHERIKRKVKEMSMVQKISCQISLIGNIDDLLAKTVDILQDFFDYEFCCICLLDDQSKEIAYRALNKNRQDDLLDFQMRMGKGISGWALQHGEVILINEKAYQDLRFFNGYNLPAGSLVESVLSIPIKYENKVLGLIHLEATESHSFSKSDLFVLATLAQDLAVAIKNAQRAEELKQTYLATLNTLATLIEFKDPYTAGHSKKVKEYAMLMSDKLHLSYDQKEDLEIAASLHDIGKIGIDDDVLKKPDKLSEKEFELIKLHPSLGASAVRNIKRLNEISKIIRHHHEHYNGTGYPDCIREKEIPLCSRIISVADAYDAMTSDRVYRKALSEHQACKILAEERGKQFCPVCVDAFFACLEDENKKG